MNKIATGFSLVELMVVVGIIGILVALALPRYRAFAVRGYRAEARVNLGHIAALQGIYRSLHNKYASMPTIGYIGSGVTNCSDLYLNNKLGFQPTECANTRYGYTVTGDAAQFTAIAYAPSDADERWVYGGCDGAGTVEYGKSQGDVLVGTHDLDVRVYRNIIKYCPDSTTTGNVASPCGAPPSAPPLPTPTLTPTPTPTPSCSLGGIHAFSDYACNNNCQNIGKPGGRLHLTLVATHGCGCCCDECRAGTDAAACGMYGMSNACGQSYSYGHDCNRCQ